MHEVSFGDHVPPDILQVEFDSVLTVQGMIVFSGRVSFQPIPEGSFIMGAQGGYVPAPGDLIAWTSVNAHFGAHSVSMPPPPPPESLSDLRDRARFLKRPEAHAQTRVFEDGRFTIALPVDEALAEEWLRQGVFVRFSSFGVQPKGYRLEVE